MREMTLEEIQRALDLRRGGSAHAWGWQISHCWFELRTTAPTLVGNLHLFFGACERVEFDPHWHEINISAYHDGGFYVIRDGTHLLVRCSILSAKYNVPPLF